MAEQTGKNIRVSFKKEVTFNTAPGPTSATVLRVNPSPGLQLARPLITPGEIRGDGMTPMARLGSRSVTGSYSADLSRVSFDEVLEAVVRGTWVAEADATSANIATVAETSNDADNFTRASGSFIMDGHRVGSVVRVKSGSHADNRNKNLRVVGVTATKLSVAESLTAASATATVLTKMKKLTNNATSPVRRSFYIEQYYQDNDNAVLYGGCRFHGLTLRGAPDGMATIEFPVTGVSLTSNNAAASPYFTSPTVSATDGLTFVDARIRYGDSDIAIATSFEMTLAVPAATLPIIGATVSPDVFDEELAITGSMTALRQGGANVASYDNETEYEVFIMLAEPASTAYISVYLPRIKVTSVDAPLGGAGALVETLGFNAGIKGTSTGYDPTMITITTGAAAS